MVLCDPNNMVTVIVTTNTLLGLKEEILTEKKQQQREIGDKFYNSKFSIYSYLPLTWWDNHHVNGKEGEEGFDIF